MSLSGMCEGAQHQNIVMHLTTDDGDTGTFEVPAETFAADAIDMINNSALFKHAINELLWDGISIFPNMPIGEILASMKNSDEDTGTEIALTAIRAVATFQIFRPADGMQRQGDYGDGCAREHGVLRAAERAQQDEHPGDRPAAPS